MANAEHSPQKPATLPVPLLLAAAGAISAAVAAYRDGVRGRRAELVVLQGAAAVGCGGNHMPFITSITAISLDSTTVQNPPGMNWGRSTGTARLRDATPLHRAARPRFYPVTPVIQRQNPLMLSDCLA